MKDGVVEWLATIPIVDATMRVPGLRGAHPRGYEALQRAAANRNSAKEWGLSAGLVAALDGWPFGRRLSVSARAILGWGSTRRRHHTKPSPRLNLIRPFARSTIKRRQGRGESAKPANRIANPSAAAVCIKYVSSSQAMHPFRLHQVLAPGKIGNVPLAGL
jgi:hypothetical protein